MICHPPHPQESKMTERGTGGTGEHTDDLAEAAGIIAGILMGTACWAVIALFWWIAR
jgi:hypothetical protein